VELKQENNNIPRDTEANKNLQTGGGRQAIKAGKSSKYYLKEFQDKFKGRTSAYRGESFTTIDSEIITFFYKLMTEGKVSRDWQDTSDASCWAIGAYFKIHGYVPDLGWYSYIRRLNLSREDPGNAGSDYGASASVMVGMETA